MNSIKKSLISFVIIILFWQGIIEIFHFPKYILPTPTAVGTTLIQSSSLIFHEAAITLIETLSGLLLSVLFATCAALLLMMVRPLRLFLLPLILISQAVPTFAIAPILVLWLGFGIGSKIMMVVLMTFFPMTSALFDGLTKTPEHYLAMATTMRGKKINIIRYIYFPNALPFLASGLRVAVVFAPMGAIIGEWVGASQGLGYLIVNANARLDTSLVFSAIILLILMSLILYYLTDKTLKRWITW